MRSKLRLSGIHIPEHLSSAQGIWIPGSRPLRGARPGMTACGFAVVLDQPIKMDAEQAAHEKARGEPGLFLKFDGDGA
ncbi:hypothetical protein [Variibacter gotjawalensis]|uniref:hypothetical protein n=1 Tax=Variibacter gotjawalensis TaxID=1333996 RepID=UPI00102C0488|nr:hypothetical protein [Variibacter gotjawalensis]NIK49519.1 hypothetical protein [Variibacter gotjawalensis]